MAYPELDPERFHRFDMWPKSTRTAIYITGLLFVVVVIPIFLLFYYKAAVNRPNQTQDEITTHIEGGQGIYEIAAQLYDLDAINSEFLFKFYLVVNRIQGNIQAGTYVIPAGTSIAELGQMLQLGKNDIRITFIEGWRVEEFAKEASEKFPKIDYAEFLVTAANNEGYLFPDTYEFKDDVTEEQMIDTLRNNFDTRTNDVLTQNALGAAGLTLEQTVIFASIIEREVLLEEDRQIVAGILLTRWRDETKLDTDATTQYAVAAHRYGCTFGGTNGKELIVETVCPDAEEVPNVVWWPQDLTLEELQLDNPHNTRAVVGLPPTPISNPSLSAIKAVLNAMETDYYFYLTDVDGVTHYAETLDEHNVNVNNYL